MPGCDRELLKLSEMQTNDTSFDDLKKTFFYQKPQKFFLCLPPTATSLTESVWMVSKFGIEMGDTCGH